MNSYLNHPCSPLYQLFLFEKIIESTGELQFVTSLSTVFLYVSCEILQFICDAILSTVTNYKYVWVIDCDEVTEYKDIRNILHIANGVASKYKHHLTQVVFQHPTTFIHTMLHKYWHELSDDLRQIIVIAELNN